ncbi:hypothetical protein AB5I41_06900 [Sphingomonas sp. MMS24-JH45]
MPRRCPDQDAAAVAEALVRFLAIGGAAALGELIERVGRLRPGIGRATSWRIRRCSGGSSVTIGRCCRRRRSTIISGRCASSWAACSRS